MSLLLGLALIGSSLIGQPILRAREWGTRLLAVTLLLTATFVISVTGGSQPFVFAIVVGIALLTLTTFGRSVAAIAGSGRPVTGSPTPRAQWRPSNLFEPTTVAVALTLWLLARNTLAVGPGARAFAPYLLALVVLVGTDLLRSIGPLEQVALVRPFSAFVVAVLLLAPYVGQPPWLECRAGKCSIAGQIYRGVFPSENGMAIFAAFTIVLALAIPQRSNRFVHVGALLILLLLTGARTALFGLAMAVAGAKVLTNASRRDEGGELRLPLGVCLSIAIGLTTGAATLLATADALTLSGRGRTWRAALDQVPLSSLWGAGSSRWGEMQELGLLTQHFPHSQYLHLQFSGGLIALALWSILLASLLGKAVGPTKADLANGLMPVLLLGIFGATEIIWNPATVDSFTVLIVAALLLSPRTTVRPAGGPGLARRPAGAGLGVTE